MKLHLRATGCTSLRSLAIWDNTVLPSTRHKWAHPAWTAAWGRYSIYLPLGDRRLGSSWV